MQAVGLDLLVPGMLGPMSGLGDKDAVPLVQTLELVLSRAGVSNINHKEYAPTLFYLFGISSNQFNDLHTAPYCRLEDGGQSDDRYWLQLSPVHLQPDRDGLLLFDTAHLHLSLDEAQQLADLVREHFSDRDWTLELFEPERWYLGLYAQPDLQTSPLTDVIGRNINGYLPKGGEATEWHVVLNELQMLLHTSKVNMLREGRGQLPINGLWLHGGGSYQEIEQTRYARLSGNDPLLRGVGHSVGAEVSALPQDSSELAGSKKKQLVVYEGVQRSVLDADHYGWVEAVEEFNRWLEPLLEAVRSNRLGYINLYPCNGTIYQINSGLLRRFWKRRKPLITYISG